MRLIAILGSQAYIDMLPGARSAPFMWTQNNALDPGGEIVDGDNPRRNPGLRVGVEGDFIHRPVSAHYQSMHFFDGERPPIEIDFIADLHALHRLAQWSVA